MVENLNFFINITKIFLSVNELNSNDDREFVETIKEIYTNTIFAALDQVDFRLAGDFSLIY